MTLRIQIEFVVFFFFFVGQSSGVLVRIVFCVWLKVGFYIYTNTLNKKNKLT